MVVTMLGAGGMARGIATRLISGGAELQILGPNVAKAAQLAHDVEAASVGVTPGVIGDSLAGDIAIVAVPYSAVADVLGEYAGQLDGRILVDITNPLNADFNALVTPADSSAAEEIARLLPLGVTVVKAFNTAFASTLLAGEVAGQPLDIFIAGDDDGAKSGLDP